MSCYFLLSAVWQLKYLASIKVSDIFPDLGVILQHSLHNRASKQHFPFHSWWAAGPQVASHFCCNGSFWVVVQLRCSKQLLLSSRAIYTQIRGGRKSKKRREATDNVLIIIRFGDSYNDMNLLQKIIAKISAVFVFELCFSFKSAKCKDNAMMVFHLWIFSLAWRISV